MNKPKTIKNLIKGDILISDLVNQYPQVVDFLINEYNLFCLNCFLSDYETFEEGCKVHGIEGKDFKELVDLLNKKIGNY